MLIFKKIIIILLFILSSSYCNYSQVLMQGEFLEYNVSYLGVSIANIKYYNDGTEVINKRVTAKTRVNVFTYSHIPLVNAKARMESWVDKNGFHSHKFVRNLSLRDKPWEYQKIEFLYDKDLLTNNKWINNKNTSSINYQIKSNSQIHDAIGLFLKVRNLARAGNSSSILTYLDEAPFNTRINYKSKKENISVDAVSGKVRSIYATGSADWQKQFGLTGGFEAWFSDDDARVPLKAKADFIIGNISIELVKYKRAGWKPPR